MKKYIVFIFAMIIIQNSLFSQTGTITNIQVSQRTDGSGLADIYFTLTGTAPTYYIAVEASFNGGTTFSPVPATALSGDTGPITAGVGKHIIWNGLQSFPNTYSTQAKLKLTVSTTPPTGLPCSGTPIVVYGGQTYNTVQIGTQCWLKENMNIGTRINGSQNQTNNQVIEKYCYNDLESNCDIYGGLYQWDEAMQYVTTPGVQGICPAGWHMPTDAEWTVLTTFLGGESVAGGKMKETGTTHWLSPNTAATNSSGFTALPGGDRYYLGSFGALTTNANLWSSSESSSSYARYRIVNWDNAYVIRSYYGKANGCSGRCLKDSGSSTTTPTVSTTSVSNVTQTSAQSGGNVTSDGGATVTVRGVCWSTSPNPMVSDNYTTDGGGTGTFVSAISGLSPNTPYYVRAYATNSLGTAYGNEITFISLNETGQPCAGLPTVTDSRDGKTYNTVQIGTQCWLKENMNIGSKINGTTEQTNNSVIEKYCYNNSEANCAIYGGLYQWNEMMQYVTTPGVKGICPTGWHIPTDLEWSALSLFLDDFYVAGGKLKEAGYEHWLAPNTGATNESGFTCIPAGLRYGSGGAFGNIGSHGNLWSSSEYDPNNSFYKSLFYLSSDLGSSNYSKNGGFSVRCIRDL